MTLWSSFRTWLGLDGAQRRYPRYLELIVARTGMPARSLRLNIYVVHWFVAVLTVMTIVWIATLLWMSYYHYSHRVELQHVDVMEQQLSVLQQRDSQMANNHRTMAKNYQSLLDHLSDLENKVRHLTERNHAASSQPVTSQAKGGIAAPVALNQALVGLQQQTQSQMGELETDVNRLLARPVGWPITHAAEITSRFGVRANPFGEDTYEFHKGLDFAAPYGSPVWVTAAGVVTKAGLTGPNGNLIEVDHGYGYRTAYAHLSQIKVKVGQVLKAGQLIGYSGSTGRSTGPHLHYAVFREGVLVDPFPYVE